MSLAVEVRQPTPVKRRLDLSWPAFAALAVVLVVLVVMPLFFLARYAFTDKDGALSLVNLITLANDPTMRKPFGIALLMAVSVGVLSCVIAVPLAWIAARTDMPGRSWLRAAVMASFVTPPFLGAIAWEILAAPNTGLINQV
jgi:iron(III) transport system permease protein